MTTPLQIRTKFDILPREGVRIFHFVCQRIFLCSFLSCTMLPHLLELRQFTHHPRFNCQAMFVYPLNCWQCFILLFLSHWMNKCKYNHAPHIGQAIIVYFQVNIFFSCCFWTWCLNVDTWSKAKCQAATCRAIFSVQTNRCGSNVFNACLLNWKRYCLLSSCVIFFLLFVTIHCPYEIKYDNFSGCAGAFIL